MLRRTIVALAIAALLAASPAARAGDLPPSRPSDGQDVLLLPDGHHVRGIVESQTEDTVRLRLPAAVLDVPRGRIAEVRLFRDYDPEPRDDAERAEAEKGRRRFDGKWLSDSQIASVLRKEAKEARERWEDNAARWDWDNRWQRKSKHFEIHANINRADVEFYETLLEDFYDYFTSAFKVSARRRIPVHIFRTRAEFQAFRKKDTGGTGESTVGYFVPRIGQEHLVLFHDARDRAETLDTLFHETTHLFVHLAGPAIDIPPMANEGLAEYYGALIYRDGRFERGRVVDHRLLALQELLEGEGLIPVRELLAAGHPDDLSPPPEDYGLDHYAMGWALVHFLFHGEDGRHLKGFGRYLNAWWNIKLKEAGPGSHKDYMYLRFADDLDLFRKSLRFADLAELDAALEEHVRSLKLEGGWAHLARARRRLWKDADTRTAEDVAAGKVDLERAEAKAEGDPDLLAALVGEWASLEGGAAKTATLLDRALAHDPLDIGRRYDLSVHLSDDAAEKKHLSIIIALAPDGPEAAGATAWLAVAGQARDLFLADDETAATLRAADPVPDDADADLLRDAARRHLRLALPEEALALLERSLAAAPGDPETLELLVRARVGKGDAAGAVAALADLEKALRETPGPGGDPLPPATLDRRVGRVAVDAAAWALAADRAAEAAAFVTARGDPAQRPEAGEGEWFLWLGLPLRGGDFETANARLRDGFEHGPQTDRLFRLIEDAFKQMQQDR